MRVIRASVRSQVLLVLLVWGVCLPKATSFGEEAMQPPIAKVIPHETTIHGMTMADDYFWLRDRDNPEVIKYLEAENAYTEARMKHTEDSREKLFEEMVGRIMETDLTYPYKKKGYFYYTRTEQGKQYPIYCRKKESLEAPEEIYLDANAMAEGKDYFAIGASEPSPDQQLFAYAVDFTGSEQYTLHIRDLKTGRDLPDSVENLGESIVWSNDGKSLFYTTLDETHRPYRLYRHVLGTPVENDALVHEEKDLSFFLFAYKTLSEKYIIVGVGNKDTAEMYWLDAATGEGVPAIFFPRQKGVEYYIAHRNNEFYVRTNQGAKDFKIMVLPEKRGAFAESDMKEFLAHRDQVRLEAFTVFKNFMVIFERDHGVHKLRIHGFQSGKARYVTFPEKVYSLEMNQANEEFDATRFRYEYTSMTIPRSVYDWDMMKHENVLLKRTEVQGDFDPDDYKAERVYAIAPDGTKIPISLVYRKGFKRNGTAPLYLYGYGAYGITYDPYFSTPRLSLLNRGFVFALAHVRGGGFLGEDWYQAGKLKNKKNTFSDFIACAEFLVKKKYCAPDRVVASGGSAGGMLMGAITNMRPDLFKVVIASVPFVDVINTMLDPSLPLTVTEYDEWGNPNDKEYFDAMIKYSPYENVENRTYPNMFISGGLNDPRVQYWEPAKWTAKLRTHDTGQNTILLKINMGAGHGGASGRYDFLKELAYEYLFIFDHVGVKF